MSSIVRYWALRRGRSAEMNRPTIWLIAATSFFSTLGNTALSTGVIWIFVREYGDAQTAGVMLAVCAALAVLLSPTVGAVLDRPRGLLLVLVADYGALAVLVGLLCSVHGRSSLGLWIAMMATALGGMAYGPGLQMLIGRLVTTERRRNANAKLHSANRSALIVGPPIGGAIVSLSGQQGLLVFDAATFMLSGAVLTYLYIGRGAHAYLHRTHASESIGFRDSLRFMLGNRTVRWVLLVGATVNMLTSGFSVLLPVLAARNSGSGVSYGVLYSTYQAGMLIVAVALSSEKSSRLAAGRDSLTIACALAVFSAGFASTVLVGDLWLLGLSVFFVGVGLSATSLFADTKFLISVPKEMQGRVFAAANSIFGSLRPVGNAGGGVLASTSTVAVGLVAAATAAGCAAVIAVRKPL